MAEASLRTPDSSTEYLIAQPKETMGDAKAEGSRHWSGRIQVIPAMMPPSQTKLSFDKVKCAANDKLDEDANDIGTHFDIVWEPLERAPLSRDAFLTQGCWQVSLHAVPIPHATQPYVDTSWSRFTLVKEKGSLQPSVLCAFRQVGLPSPPPATNAPPSSPHPIAAEPWSAPLEKRCQSSPGWMGIPITIRALRA